MCEEAGCPNIGECWEKKHATFMIMGDTCTRACAFCNVKTGLPGALDPNEPAHVGEATAKLGLAHIVVTSVDRDDLADGGAQHFADTIRAIRARCPADHHRSADARFPAQGRRARTSWSRRRPDVFNHNLETVPSLYLTVRPGARYFHSLRLLQRVKEIDPAMFTKSGIMVGLGEERNEVLQVMDDLRSADVDFLTIGQYLQPTRKHHEVDALRAAGRIQGAGDDRLRQGIPDGVGLAADALVASRRRGFRAAARRRARARSSLNVHAAILRRSAASATPPPTCSIWWPTSRNIRNSCRCAARMRCAAAREKGDGVTVLVADMTVAYKLIHQTFTSRVTLDRPNLKILVEYLDGPFRHMQNRWTFHAGGRATPATSSSSSTTNSRAARWHADGRDVRHRVPPLGGGVREARRRGLRPRLARPCYSSARTCGTLSTR